MSDRADPITLVHDCMATTVPAGRLQPRPTGHSPPR